MLHLMPSIFWPVQLHRLKKRRRVCFSLRFLPMESNWCLLFQLQRATRLRLGKWIMMLSYRGRHKILAFSFPIVITYVMTLFFLISCILTGAGIWMKVGIAIGVKHICPLFPEFPLMIIRIATLKKDKSFRRKNLTVILREKTRRRCCFSVILGNKGETILC